MKSRQEVESNVEVELWNEAMHRLEIDEDDKDALKILNTINDFRILIFNEVKKRYGEEFYDLKEFD